MSINDELVWQSLNHAFCSFKAKVQTHNFCRHEMNVTGLCNKSSCPLANGRYATVREEDGKCYLYIKTIERAHMPRRLWQKQLLPRNYEQALAVVTEQLEHYPKFLIHRNKQRLTRIHQYLIRMRKLARRSTKTVVTEHIKVDRREARREKKALVAAKLTQSIQTELLARLKQGTYGDIYNFPEAEYNEALNDVQVDDTDRLVEAEENDEPFVQFVEAELAEDIEENGALLAAQVELPVSKRSALNHSPAVLESVKSKKKKRRVEIEYDDQDQDQLVLEAPVYA